jgi:transcriptional regulator with XRE-family HTH domain
MNNILLQDRVKTYLRENGKVQKWLAEKVGVSQSMFSQWLRNKVSFNNKQIQEIIDIVSGS